jgi:hypothetical protein
MRMYTNILEELIPSWHLIVTPPTLRNPDASTGHAALTDWAPDQYFPEDDR